MSDPNNLFTIDLDPVRVASSLSFDLESNIKSLPRDEKTILQVFDATFDGARPQKLRELNTGDDIEEALNNLPPHDSGVARILDVTVRSDFVVTGLRETQGPERTKPARATLLNFLRDTYARRFEERRLFRWLSDPLLVNDIGSITSQWTQHLSDSKQHLHRVVNRSSLQQHPFDYDVRPRDSYMTCAQDTRDRLIVIIVHDVWYEQEFGTKKTKKALKLSRTKTNGSYYDDEAIHFNNPRCTSKMLAGESLTSCADGTLENFAKLMVLDFFLASIYLQPVDYFGALIYPRLSERDVIKVALTKNPHLQVPLGLFEPRLSAKSNEAFKEIEDAEGIRRNVDNLIDSIKFVTEALEPIRNPALAQSRRQAFKASIQWVHEICTERGRNAQRALDALNRQLDYLTKRHSIREAKAIRTLTILASFYLPLSLAAAALGMQSPFKLIAHDNPGKDSFPDADFLKGTNLLFDFFGVFIGLSALTIFAVYGIGLALRIKTDGLAILSKALGFLSRRFGDQFDMWHYGRGWRFGGRGGRYFQLLRATTKVWLVAGFCITLLVIFMMGMLKGAQDAWDTARWMFAAYITVSVLLLINCIVVYRWLLLTKLRDWKPRRSIACWLEFCGSFWLKLFGMQRGAYRDIQQK